jgi:hypothetical protein
MTTDQYSPIAGIPLHACGETFTMQPTVGARWMAAKVEESSRPETNTEALERVIKTICELMPDPGDRQRFSALWDSNPQGVLLDLYDEVIEHYTRRPTLGPSPYSSGFGIRSDGSTSTRGSSSPAALASVPSPATSGDS